MRLIARKGFLVQQQTAHDEHYRFVQQLLATGNCKVSIPPDCFLWTGTEKELIKEMKKFDKEYGNSNK